MIYDPDARLKAFAESIRLGDAVARAKRKAERERARRAANFEFTLDIVQRAVGRPAPQQTSTLAEQIIMAGQKRRGEIPIAPLSDPTADSMAAAILRAGARRRGEVPEPEDNSPAAEKAKLIILAGKRRRGEIE